MTNPNDPASDTTIRQDFVKAAMQGLCANPILCDVSEFAIAEQAVRHADATLAEEARTRAKA